jgi:hypothetical protein
MVSHATALVAGANRGSLHREGGHVVNLLRRHRFQLGAVALATGGLIAAVVIPGVSASSQSSSTPEGFIGVTPTRVLDTRTPPVGVATAAPVGPGATVDLPLTTTAPNRPGVPVPTGAVSVLLNVTVDSDATAPSFITVWPTGSPKPTTSVINPKPGTVVSGSILVPLGTGGSVSIFNFAGNANVIVDLAGYTMALSGSGGSGAQGPPGPPGAPGAPGAPGQNAPGFVTTHSTGPDSGFCGNDWANDDYTRTLQFIPQNDGTVQVIRLYSGTFTTFPAVAQPNPPGQPGSCTTALQTGGVTGAFTGFDVVVVTGGTFTPNATCPDPCTTPVMLATFFPAEAPGDPAATSVVNDGWEFKYDAGAKGVWFNRSTPRGGSKGNVTG